MLSGILVIDKPAGCSSAGALRKVKGCLGKPPRPKVGHAGTLDPFATGILLALVGSATKQSQALMGQPKQYLATIKLGATTPTLDPTSEETPGPPVPLLTQAGVADVLARFTGTILQTPPVYSALKVGGRRMYQLARQGREVPVEPRPVTIYSIDLLGLEGDALHLHVHCGRGTYIRALARDIAEAFGTIGYLTELRRTAVGDFTLECATPLRAIEPQNLPALLR